MKEALLRIAYLYGVSLTFVEEGDSWIQANGKDAYTNSSSYAGDHIWLGLYENEELKRISFWHELGHVLVARSFPDPMALCAHYPCLAKLLHPSEPLAWRFGLMAASLEGEQFSHVARQEWAMAQLMSYTLDSGDRLSVYGPMDTAERCAVLKLSGL